MAKAKAPGSKIYDGSSIRQLKGLKAVRERCGMFLGDPTNGDALHHMIEEVVANSVDESLAGHCDTITVELLPDGWAQVTDNGRGIPVEMNPEEGISALQMVMCSLFAGGKFDNNSYEQSAGLHGVGVSAVNAVSEVLEATVWRNGHLYTQQYAAGEPTTEVADMGAGVSITGTKIKWKRDLTIFKGVIDYDRKLVADRIQELAFLNPGLTITLTDTRGKSMWSHEYQFDDGIKQYLDELVGKKSRLTPVLSFSDEHNCEIAMVWTDSDSEDIRCYVNNTYNRDGGTHLTGFKNGLVRVILGYIKEHGLAKGLGEEGVTGNDIREGITAIVNLRMSQIAFSSQTKEKLVTPQGRTIVEALFQDRVEYFFKQNPGTAKKIAEKALLSARMREAARKAREQIQRKDFMDPLSLPGKLADCQSKDPRVSEIFIVEGESAGGSAKGARDRRMQAILPLRGKVLNVERSDAEAILENKELGTMITALGCGIEQAKNFNLAKLRYHKVILMTDADVDGAHIQTLLLTFFYRCMPRLIYGGFIYIAQPPLFGFKLRGSKAPLYFIDDVALEAYRATLTHDQRMTSSTSRYKGLGEMNAEDLWATTLDPLARSMKQVTIQDAIEAEQYFNLLMGEDVEGRRAWIEDNAYHARDLDI